MEQYMSREPHRYRPAHVFYFSYICFFTWNLLTTWWIYNASLGGAALAIIANAFLMALVFMIYSILKRRHGEKKGPFILIALWITFEFLHLDWDLSWPWLTLGNAFAADHTWIQWYEYTGVFGGSLWILLVNVLVLQVITHLVSKRSMKGQWMKLASAGALILVPIIISLIIYSNRLPAEGTRPTVDVAVVQPNIDPYNAKFTTNPVWQASEMVKLATPLMDTAVDYLVLPETALSDRKEIIGDQYVIIIPGIWEHEVDKAPAVMVMKELMADNHGLKIVAGASTNKEFMNGEKPSLTARPLEVREGYFDAFNTALQLGRSDTVQVYHKSKLVPGVEKMPFPALLKPLEDLAIDMGGTSGSLGMQDERTVFTSPEGVKVAPVICYESIYGEYVSEYVKNGANAIFIVTNDGWWGDTPGYKQHLVYGRLRAIETRRSIARSANTGISCFVNERGDISQPLGWWAAGAIRSELTVNDELTFYTRFGDYIARGALLISSLLIVYSIVHRFRRFKKS